MAACSSATLLKMPARTRRVVRSRKKRSTMFSHEALVGVKWRWKRGCRLSHVFTLGCLCVA